MSWEEVIAEQRRDLPISLSPEKCAGATYIVTGTNIGLGLETARHLIGFGSARVILAVRNLTAGEEALRDIEKTTGKTGIGEVWHLDLTSYESVKKFAARANAELERLHGLIENAAVSLDTWSTAEGHETCVTTNVYSTFLLGVLLFEKLRETGKKYGVLPHLVIVSSSYAFMFESEVDGLRKSGLPGLDDESSANMDARYAVSKMIELFVGFRLSELLPVEQTGVVINLLNPGIVKTALARHSKPDAAKVFLQTQESIGRTAEMGSRTLLHAASAGKPSHGKFVSDCKIKQDSVPSWLTDEAGVKLQDKLYNDVVKELEKIEPGCVSRIL